VLDDCAGDVVQDTDMPTISSEGCETKCNDPVLVSVVKKHHGWITKVHFSVVAFSCRPSVSCGIADGEN